MPDTLVVGDIHVHPGERVTQVVDVPVGDGTVGVPVIAIHGRRPGPRVSITGGIHGGEYVGIETARRIGMELDPAEIAGSLVIIPVANPAAFRARAVYSSALDTHNINRVFPGNPAGDPSERLAFWLFETVIRPSTYHIDLHGGDLIEALKPFVLYVPANDQRVEETSRRMALATGISTVIRTEVQGAAYAEASMIGIPSIIAEIGEHGMWDNATVERFRGAVQGVLQSLQVLPGERPIDETLPIYKDLPSVFAPVDGLFYPLVELGDRVTRGQIVGTITYYFGRELHRCEAPVDGEVVLVVSTLVTNKDDFVVCLAS
jgi:uncharacterized protein